MANVKLAPHLAALRGSIAGTTYTANRSGSIMREKKYPRDPRSNAQQTRREIHRAGIAYWKDTLTDAQRINWNTLATTTQLLNRAGQYYQPSGMNLFMRSFEITYDMPGGPIILAPATAVAGPVPFTYRLAFAQGVGGLTLFDDNGWLSGKTGYLHVWFRLMTTQSIYAYKGPWMTDVWVEIPPTASPPDTSIFYPISGGGEKHLFTKTIGVYAGGTITLPQFAMCTTVQL